MFAILGVFLIRDRLWYCKGIVDFYDVDQVECEERGFTWANRPFNFDDIFQGIITLFVLSSLEGWPTIMQWMVDSREAKELGPTPDAYKEISIFVLGFIVVGAFFFMNLFVGVIFEQFQK